MMMSLRKIATALVAIWHWVIRRQVEQVKITAKSPKKETSTSHELSDCVWNFRTNLLERLDEYFICLRRLRKWDADSYALFSRVGFAISADTFANGSHQDNRRILFDKRNAWSFGGIMFPHPQNFVNEGHVYPSFIYFRKLNRPSYVESFKGDIYSVTVLYDERNFSERWRSKFQWPVQCHVGVDPCSRTFRLLKERCFKNHYIKTGKKRGKASMSIRFPSYQWKYPDWLMNSEALNTKEDAESRAVDFLVAAIVTYQKSLEKIIIRATTRGMTAAFSIEVNRAKYFFKDRDSTILASDGKRKRIFHSVRKHTRTLGIGRVTSVKYHYRGLRHFEWKDYRIGIVFPAKNNILAFPVSATNEEDMKSAELKEWSDSKEVGQMFARELSA